MGVGTVIRARTAPAAPAGTVGSDRLRATSRASASTIRVSSVTGAGSVSRLRRSVRIDTVAPASDTAGVVTYVPQRSTCTGPVASIQTWR